jgi:hypothetical protein
MRIVQALLSFGRAGDSPSRRIVPSKLPGVGGSISEDGFSPKSSMVLREVAFT